VVVGERRGIGLQEMPQRDKRVTKGLSGVEDVTMMMMMMMKKASLKSGLEASYSD
jgi:hypothetical protein